MVRQCYNARLQAKAQSNTFIGLDIRDKLIEEHSKPLGDPLKIPLMKGDPNWTVRIGSDLDQVTKERLATLLDENANIFAWFVANMPGTDLDVMVHKMNIDPTYRLVKQKKWSFVP